MWMCCVFTVSITEYSYSDVYMVSFQVDFDSFVPRAAHTAIMACPCWVGDITIQGLETERPRLVRSVSTAEPRSPLPRSVSRMNLAANEYKLQNSSGKLYHDTGQPKTVKAMVIRYTNSGQPTEKTRGTDSRGILRQPTTKFPFEDKQYLRPHITKRPSDRLRAEIGVDSAVPASDVIKVHAYRRRGVPVKQDQDLSLMFDKAPIKKGDVVVGKTFAESSLARADVKESKNSNASKNNAPARGAKSPEW